ncbi:hypothetical protein JZY91_05805 [Corynebacterium sp. CNCTC7651]|uniref:hypothetical protein n=1 Tax=Corynebacterium sp. CNCTC7651 TaxID=2815361 RepID=UPI001F299A05|nr:hypothetical protein [Corynebacterium sp. CNCTC7651]UIZ93227.1 hypothetical protein JZY91_05805 [Corynebacterium sp. CNCTC7651]
MSEASAPQGRSGWQYATPIAMLVAYIFGPWLLIPAFGGGDSAVVPIIAFIFGVAAVAGFVDGATFRTTASLPILAGVGFWVAKALYFNDGTFLYLIGCVATAWLAMLAGSQLNRTRLNRTKQAA